jgi:transposase
VTAATGAVRAIRTVPADPHGYAELVALAAEHGRLRAWAIEGTGDYGAGLARHLAKAGELVVELARPARPARRAGPSPTRSTPSAPPGTARPHGAIAR